MNDVIPRVEESDAEIELSAQDLLALSASPQVEPDPSPIAKASKPAKSAPLRKLGPTLSVIVAIGIVGATYALSTPNRTNPSTAETASQPAASGTSVPQQLAQGEPVRFANPFDTDEVFEFPPGTTEAQARDAVADVLLKRAMSRQKT